MFVLQEREIFVQIGKLTIFMKQDMVNSLAEAMMFWAVQHGQSILLQELLNHFKLDPEERDILRQTPLMHSARKKDYQCMKILLQAGAKVNAADAKGRTPLVHCTHDLDLKLSPDQIDVMDFTQVHMTYKGSDYCCQECVNLLLSYGAKHTYNIREICQERIQRDLGAITRISHSGITISVLTNAVQSGCVPCTEALAVKREDNVFLGISDIMSGQVKAPNIKRILENVYTDHQDKDTLSGQCKHRIRSILERQGLSLYMTIPKLPLPEQVKHFLLNTPEKY